MAKTKALDKLKEKTADLKPTVFTQQVYIKDSLIVLPELKNLIPPLREEEFQQLESNLLANGIKDPLTIWETTTATVADGLASDSASHRLLTDLDASNKIYILIDGHNRYALSNKHRLDYRINIIEFENLDTVRDYMINFQLGRRNLTPEQASYLRGLRYNKMKEGNRSDRINVAQQLAEEYSVSTRTIKRDSEYAKGMEGLAPELKNEVMTGKAKLPKAAAKALAKGKVDKPIETLDELNKVLENMPGSFKNLDDLKATKEDFDDAKSQQIDALIRGVSSGTQPKSKDPAVGKSQTDTVPVSTLQQDLKSLVGKDLSNKEVLQEIIRKARALLQKMK